MTMAAASVACFGIELETALGQRLYRFGRLRLEHDQLARIEPARQPAVEHGGAHLAGAEQHQTAGKFGEGALLGLRTAMHLSAVIIRASG